MIIEKIDNDDEYRQMPSRKEKVHFKLTDKEFRYLGMIITPNTHQLYEANYGKWMN